MPLNGRRYSAMRILREGVTGNHGWDRAWRDPEPKARYDAIIVGGGGHGLATAFYLAKEHGMTNVAVLEKGWLGGGNAGRNTTIVRSNYILPGNTQFYEFSLKIWENLSQDLNYNVHVQPARAVGAVPHPCRAGRRRLSRQRHAAQPYRRRAARP